MHFPRAYVHSIFDPPAGDDDDDTAVDEDVGEPLGDGKDGGDKPPDGGRRGFSWEDDDDNELEEEDDDDDPDDEEEREWDFLLEDLSLEAGSEVTVTVMHVTNNNKTTTTWTAIEDALLGCDVR